MNVHLLIVFERGKSLISPNSQYSIFHVNSFYNIDQLHVYTFDGTYEFIIRLKETILKDTNFSHLFQL